MQARKSFFARNVDVKDARLHRARPDFDSRLPIEFKSSAERGIKGFVAILEIPE